MTLDELRKQVVVEIKKCDTKIEATELIEETKESLDKNEISSEGQKHFWNELSDELIVLKEQSATTLSPIITAAQNAIAQHSKKS
ncbi:MAG: hypothetical protein GC179_30750 [Anaerolineaceae bacterium]|nr:hypothetical protein [Anaerolineaceae bacterium]